MDYSFGRDIRRRALSPAWRVAHGAIVVNYLANIGYAAYEVFFQLRPEGVKPGMPLGAAASDIDPDLMAQRRGYAAEAWLSIAGLTTYLALTEVGPRVIREVLVSVADGS